MKKIIALAVAAVVAAPAMADLTISANVENTTTFTSDVTANTTDVNVSFAGMTKAESGAYISAKGDLRLEGETTGTGGRDRWVELGTDGGNIRLGAFEGVDGFNAGKDTYVALATGSAQATAANVYTGNSIRGRNGGNQFALNGNMGAASVQLLGSFSANDDTVGLRPAVTLDLGMATVTAVYEDLAGAGVDGYALKAATSAGGVDLGVSYAKNDAANAVSTTSVTAGMGNFGAGVYMHKIDDNVKNEQTRVFVAYTIPDVMGVEGANVTLAASNASTDEAGIKDATGAAVRINYAF